MDSIFTIPVPSSFLLPNSAFLIFQRVRLVLESPTTAIPVPRSPQPPQVRGSLDLPGLGIQSSSELWFITVTGQSRISQGKRHTGDVREKPDTSPSGESLRMHFPSPAACCDNTGRVLYQRLGAQGFHGAGHMGTSAWPVPTFQSPEEAGFPRDHVVCANSLMQQALPKSRSQVPAGADPVNRTL